MLSLARWTRREERQLSEPETAFAAWAEARQIAIGLLPSTDSEIITVKVKIRRKGTFWKRPSNDQVLRSYLTLCIFFEHDLDCYCYSRNDRSGYSPCFDLQDALIRVQAAVSDAWFSGIT